MRLFRSFIVLAILGTIPFSLTGCGGSNDSSPSPSPSPSTAASAVRAEFIGNFQGSWGGFGGGGKATLSVSPDGSYKLFLQNYGDDYPNAQNVVTVNLIDVNLAGKLSSSGHFSSTVPGTKFNDILDGTFDQPLIPKDTTTITLTRSHRLIQQSGGSISLTRAN